MLISRQPDFLFRKNQLGTERIGLHRLIYRCTDGQQSEKMKMDLDLSRYEMLMRAISKKVGVDDEMAGQISLRVLNYFGYEDSIIDNALDQDDRRLFYFLQDVAILKTDWEEAILPSGRTWRIFYWSLNNENIASIAMDIEVIKAQMGIYEALPEDIWSREPLTQGAQ
jgi:hypothetical protein